MLTRLPRRAKAARTRADLSTHKELSDAMKSALFWGDIHNHNAVGYAKGSLERSFDIARSHLDFFAHTGHAQWHDMPKMPNDAHMKWVRGFEVMRRNWPKVAAMTRDAHQPGEFVTFLGYEWHSSFYGDYCIYYPGDEGELEYFDSSLALQTYCLREGCLAIPHHVGYKAGWRGFNWDHFDPRVSPVCEIFSEHGACERDRGLHPMIRHSNGGRDTASCIQAALRRGLRFGFAASTDDHLGYPGAYGEGLMAVFADELTRDALWRAIRERRTYAVTGDRIEIDFELNGRPMGSELPAAAAREIRFRVEGWDEISMVELIRNGRAIATFRPLAESPWDPWPGRAKLRVEWGWGPWADLNMARTADWDLTLRVDAARIRRGMTCFQSGPFEERKRNRVLSSAPQEWRWESYTSRRQAFEERATNAIVFELEGPADARVSLAAARPGECSIQRSLAELAAQSAVEFTGPFTSESVLAHRLAAPAEYVVEAEYVDERPDALPGDHYYLRVTQANGQMAWTSPVWVG